MKNIELKVLLFDIILQTIVISGVIWYIILNNLSWEDFTIFIFGLMVYQMICSILPNYFFRQNIAKRIQEIRKKQLIFNVVLIILGFILLVVMVIYEDGYGMYLDNRMRPLVFELVVRGIGNILFFAFFVSSLYYFIVSIQDWHKL